FIVKIPLTLAIVSALIISAGGERFAIPQIGVDELVRVTDESEHRIETINDTRVLRLRNRLLPLVALDEMLKIRGADEAVDGKSAGKTRGRGDETCIVVARVGTSSFGIIVDQVFESEEIVVKPVTPVLRGISIFSGNTILGDGSVIMILDPNGVAAAIGESIVADGHVSDEAPAHGDVGSVGERTTLLVFRAGAEEPLAVPLALVARLEEIDVGKIEETNGQPVVQYRGQLMPLVSVGAGFTRAREGRQQVIVFSDSSRSMGLMVDEIVDIVEDRLSVQLASKHTGVIGTAVVAGRATEVIDAAHYLEQAFGDWFRQGKGRRSGTEGRGGSNRILLVDDSPFFRNLLMPLLSVAGYDVTAVEDAARALALRDSGQAFDVIISDIEMPGMDGFDLARAIREGGAWKDTPLLALSAYSSAGDLDRGRTVGFTDYIAKLDRDALLQSLSHTLSSHRGAA
ncbi:MAG TPA: chemotaxis protein CheW, partial [Candidatus Limnocylindria bacterium]|nr:chemotaxis protein CheW [Candidatus Limnocylindria bacterium]